MIRTLQNYRLGRGFPAAVGSATCPRDSPLLRGSSELDMQQEFGNGHLSDNRHWYFSLQSISRTGRQVLCNSPFLPSTFTVLAFGKLNFTWSPHTAVFNLEQ